MAARSRSSRSRSIPTMGQLDQVEEQLATFPPLVFAGEARELKAKLARVAAGKAFLLQGGDCAESFAEHGADTIRDFFRVLLQMAVVLTYAGGAPVVKVGRIAGQFAKPRSAPTETHDGMELPSYRGDIINGIEFTEAARTPDPERMLMAYRQSAATLNLLRAFAKAAMPISSMCIGGMLGFVKDSPAGHRYEEIADQIAETLAFHARLRARRRQHAAAPHHEFYTSHESAVARLRGSDDAASIPPRGDWYATSGHFLWIGDRTRQLDHAHIEFLRGIKNPIGVKIGPSLAPDELLALIDVLNPQNEPGRLTLIAASARTRSASTCRRSSARSKREGSAWSGRAIRCTATRSRRRSGYKTRPFDLILTEVAPSSTSIAAKAPIPAASMSR